MAILEPPPRKPDQSVIVKPRYFYSSRRCNIFDIFVEPIMIFWKRSVGSQPIQLSSQLPPHTVSAILGTPIPIRCTNCCDKQLMWEAHPHMKPEKVCGIWMLKITNFVSNILTFVKILETPLKNPQKFYYWFMLKYWATITSWNWRWAW